jgi:tetrahydromethanopterin S-methyltransferase subunit B
MPRVEERVAHLEGQVNELSQGLAEVKETMRHFQQRVDARFDTLDDKVSRQFMWLVGIQITTLVAIVAALISRG